LNKANICRSCSIPGVFSLSTNLFFVGSGWRYDLGWFQRFFAGGLYFLFAGQEEPAEPAGRTSLKVAAKIQQDLDSIEAAQRPAVSAVSEASFASKSPTAPLQRIEINRLAEHIEKDVLIIHHLGTLQFPDIDTPTRIVIIHLFRKRRRYRRQAKQAGQKGERTTKFSHKNFTNRYPATVYQMVRRRIGATTEIPVSSLASPSEFSAVIEFDGIGFLESFFFRDFLKPLADLMFSSGIVVMFGFYIGDQFFNIDLHRNISDVVGDIHVGQNDCFYGFFLVDGLSVDVVILIFRITLHDD
jgi:hypothetical protein